jgi:thioredoxin
MLKKTFIAILAVACTTLTIGCSGTSNKNQNINKQEVKKMNTTELTAEAFKLKIMDYEKNPQTWVFKGDKPAIIDFYATWCGPCKATAPILDSIAGAYKEQIDVYKVDVDKEQELAALFGIRSIPSLLFIPKEGDPQMQVGAMNAQQLESAVKTVLLK